MQYMCNEFYKYIDIKFIEFRNIIISKPEVYPLGHDITNTEVYLTYIKYLLYILLCEKGIYRKILTSELRDEKQPPIVLLYYKLPVLRIDDPIVQICRHMVLDTSNMAIISIGLPKSASIDIFNKEAIDNKVYFEECAERTMLIYNPSLNNIYKIVKHYIQQDDADENGDDTQQNIINLNPSISTRALIGGHSTFNSNHISIDEMFEYNNKVNNINFENVPMEILNSSCLVFNINHPENFIIKRNNTLYRNMLIAAYKFRSITETSTIWQSYIFAFNTHEITTQIINIMALNAITILPIENIEQQYAIYGINLIIPRKFEIDAMDILPLQHMTLEKSNELWINLLAKYPKIVSSIENDSPVGLMMKTISGYRIKLMLPAYEHLFKLRGNISTYSNVDTPSNIFNLFRLFWHLTKMSQKYKIDYLKEYLFHFDNEEKFYFNIFGKFHEKFIKLINKTQNIYYMVFVAHKINKHEIPYALKPICGELHNQYMITKIPTTNETVMNYYMMQDSKKLYWRLFSAELI